MFEQTTVTEPVLLEEKFWMECFNKAMDHWMASAGHGTSLPVVYDDEGEQVSTMNCFEYCKTFADICVESFLTRTVFQEEKEKKD